MARHQPHSLRGRVAETRWRGRIAARPVVDRPYRLVVGVVGSAIVIAGIGTIPLPGPGSLIILTGLCVLATEFLWAERLLAFARRHMDRWTHWLKRQPIWMRSFVGLAAAAGFAASLVVTLHFMGVPDWMPDWVPLWR